MFKVGDSVSGMYFDSVRGTVLNTRGTVTRIEAMTAERFRVHVEFDNGRTESYIVSKSGHSDFMYKN